MKRVYTDMVGDLFHIGHVEFLKKCKSFGDHLIVGINKDVDCAKHKRPAILSSEERGKMAESMQCVDEVIVNAPWFVTADLITENKIDLVIHAHPEEDQYLWEEAYQEAITRGIFKRIDRYKGISTSNILNRIKSKIEL